ncbi:hypothetical protein [Actinomadura oligospora]|uniref:hypothetical protein n=1 Tax=Actinomadura oligospora TaxID=111804 RepID=UPI000478F5FD|nr:hypothetical protein [Actinomadura oligospora]
MHNLPGMVGAARPCEDASLTAMRLRVLTDLMADLHAIDRASWLAYPLHGEPVLYVRDGGGERRLAVLGVQDAGGGWSYCWDGGRTASVDGTMRAAHQIAAATR